MKGSEAKLRAFFCLFRKTPYLCALKTLSTIGRVLENHVKNKKYERKASIGILHAHGNTVLYMPGGI